MNSQTERGACIALDFISCLAQSRKYLSNVRLPEVGLAAEYKSRYPTGVITPTGGK